MLHIPCLKRAICLQEQKAFLKLEVMISVGENSNLLKIFDLPASDFIDIEW